MKLVFLAIVIALVSLSLHAEQTEIRFAQQPLEIRVDSALYRPFYAEIKTSWPSDKFRAEISFAETLPTIMFAQKQPLQIDPIHVEISFAHEPLLLNVRTSTDWPVVLATLAVGIGSILTSLIVGWLYVVNHKTEVRGSIASFRDEREENLDHRSPHKEAGGRGSSPTSAAESRPQLAEASTSGLEHAGSGRNDDQRREKRFEL
jgi:hypothetical protein